MKKTTRLYRILGFTTVEIDTVDSKHFKVNYTNYLACLFKFVFRKKTKFVHGKCINAAEGAVIMPTWKGEPTPEMISRIRKKVIENKATLSEAIEDESAANRRRVTPTFIEMLNDSNTVYRDVYRSIFRCVLCNNHPQEVDVQQQFETYDNYLFRIYCHDESWNHVITRQEILHMRNPLEELGARPIPIFTDNESRRRYERRRGGIAATPEEYRRSLIARDPARIWGERMLEEAVNKTYFSRFTQDEAIQWIQSSEQNITNNMPSVSPSKHVESSSDGPGDDRVEIQTNRLTAQGVSGDNRLKGNEETLMQQDLNGIMNRVIEGVQIRANEQMVNLYGNSAGASSNSSFTNESVIDDINESEKDKVIRQLQEELEELKGKKEDEYLEAVDEKKIRDIDV